MADDEFRFFVHIQGHEIYETIWMPAVPRKGDVLWLSSLTRGAVKIPEVLVSRVDWAMDQQSGKVTVWIKVRRMKAALEAREPAPSSGVGGPGMSLSVLVIEPGHGSVWLNDAKYLDGGVTVEGWTWDDGSVGSPFMPDDFRGERVTLAYPTRYILKISGAPSSELEAPE